MIQRTLFALAILSLGGVPLHAHPLPVYFVPPAHYRVLKKFGGWGWYYGGQNSVSVNESLLRGYRKAARRVGANAVLLRPVCPETWCHPVVRLTPNGTYGCFTCHVFQTYTAEALLVQGPPCPYPRWLCRRMEPAKLFSRRVRDRLLEQRRPALENVRTRGAGRTWAVGLSLGTPQVASERRWLTTHPGAKVTSTFVRGTACPADERRHLMWLFPLISQPVLAKLNTNGRVSRRVTLLRSQGLLSSEELIDLMRRMRFATKTFGSQPPLLVADWHVVMFSPHKPIPAGVICWYPPCPARSCRRGRMARRLEWRVIASADGARPVLIDPVAEWRRSSP